MNKKSTLGYSSNIMSFDVTNKDNVEFYSNIHDPFALDELNDLLRNRRIDYKLTKLQEEEIRIASKHCIYAFEDDYPFGTVIINNEKKVVCKCLNQKCRYFNNCRSGISTFRESELINDDGILYVFKDDINEYKEKGNYFLKEFNIDKSIYKVKDEVTNIIDEIKKSNILVEQGNKSEKEIIVNIPDNNSTNINKFSNFAEVDQEDVIKASSDSRIIVNAGPGTGKTWTLIEKLIYMVNKQNMDPEEIIVLCFSTSAVDVIQTRLKKAHEEGLIGLNWTSIDIRTFDSLATHLLSYVQTYENELLPPKFSLSSLDYDSRISIGIKVIEQNNKLLEQCSHLIIDEIQDLVSIRAEFVMQIIYSIPKFAGYTLFGDSCQSIYDYQSNFNQINSVKFYQWLFEAQSEARLYKFTTNHRQISELEKLGNNYREAILSNDENLLGLASIQLLNQIEELKQKKLIHIDEDMLNNLREKGTVGILTRTNGQALKISTIFRNKGIPHRIQKSLSDHSLNGWIADAFFNYKNDVIDREAFFENTKFISSETKKNDLWIKIEKTQFTSQSKYKVRDLLYGISNNVKAREFYTNDTNSNIIVSNIHRSKGREYDYTILLNDTLESNSELSLRKDLNEHKVTYVALTRAKKKIYRLSMDAQYISVDKIGDRRAYKKGIKVQGKKARLSLIEIGRSYDIDPISFASHKDIQDLLWEKNLIGERVILNKNKDLSKLNGYIAYNIELEDHVGKKILGSTSFKFYEDLTRILKYTYKITSDNVYEEIYPIRFTDIYIEDYITYIGPVNLKAVAAKSYSDLIIWKGITIAGFAKVERDKY